MGLLNNVLVILFLSMSGSWFYSVYHSIKKAAGFKSSLFNLIIPFYHFYYILKIPEETEEKKYMAITSMGAFLLFFFITIILFILTPQT